MRFRHCEMKQNLDSLRKEIEQHLEGEGLSIFHGHARTGEDVVYWDDEHYPDYKLFVKAAKAAGTAFIVLHERQFDIEAVDDALEQLALADLPIEDQRTYERRLKELRVYDGFTCAIEISFDHGHRTYLYEVETEWYEELTTLMDELEFFGSGSGDDEDDDDGESAIGGYFSKN